MIEGVAEPAREHLFISVALVSSKQGRYRHIYQTLAPMSKRTSPASLQPRLFRTFDTSVIHLIECSLMDCWHVQKWALFSFILISLTTLPSLPPCHASTFIDQAHPLTDGETLASPTGVFNLGFFSVKNAGNRYVGIWQGNFSIENVVWVANRETPIRNHSGSIAIIGDGNIAVLDGGRRVLWSSNATLPSNKSTAVLSDFGDLMLNNSGAIAWESFNHPCNTYLAGMKIWLDLSNNSSRLFTAWKTANDPTPGNFSLGIDPSAQLFIWEGSRPRWRSGQWNGQVFIGIPDMVFAAAYGFKLSRFIEGNKMYYYTDFNSSHRWVLSPTGTVKHLFYWETTKIWLNLFEAPATECEKYNRCGDYGSCTDGAAPICSCLKGFVPRFGSEWNDGNWTEGCVRRTPLKCEVNGVEPDQFYLIQGIKLPDSSELAAQVVNVNDCGELCLMNCSCKAYSFVDAIGCMIWRVNLADINVFISGGNDLYLRLSSSEFNQDEAVTDKKKTLAPYIIVIIVLVGVFLIGCTSFLFCKFRRRRKEFSMQTRNQRVGVISDAIGVHGERKEDESHEIPLVSFNTILAATEGFSQSNLLGKGGFGPVYKGILSGGQEIAVKRLSRGSRQGMEEFKNEVILIAKLQHRNLVRLLGFCTENDDQILVYEYMPNKSLDSFIFEPSRKEQLDWKKRYIIIDGIARGLLYLHRDSRLRIIHRDLKASNILLDEEMNPKISDFGLARIFRSDNNETTTKRVVGTYGYMSPEYAMQGLFSVKSDVYSFGILLLEIISGKKNITYCHPGLNLNLLAYAWKLWNEENVMEFVDQSIKDSCSSDEVLRCIHLGLLCVQDRANDRPTMSSVIVMLESGVSVQTAPSQPTFTFETNPGDDRVGSVLDSITILTGR